MYLDFYKLKEFPFGLVCQERFFYESAVHAEALANMMYTVQQRKGMVLVTGEVGAGKTFVGNILASRLGAGCTSVMLPHPASSAKQLLRALATRLGLGIDGFDRLELAGLLQEHLIRMLARGRLVAMIVDEAQDMTASSLEELRLLWNWEHQGQRLVQIVLIGQPELRQKLMEPRWEPLRQRIVLSYHLAQLGRQDAAQYIAHRLAVASADAAGCRVSFLPEAVDEVFAVSNGIPRLINVVCDNSLLTGYARGIFQIDRSIVLEVVREMTCWNLGAVPAGRG
jgi:general secretion pathway protein A